MLADKIAYYKEHKKMLKNTPAGYKAKYPWLREVDSLALANAQLNLQSAYKRFFSSPDVGFPKFKTKHRSKKSYTTNNQNNTIYLEQGKLKLPKLKNLVRVLEHRPLKGIIRSCTISCVSGKYYASILVETHIEKLPVKCEKVGVDVGIKDFAILSNGTVHKNPRFLRKAQEKLAYLQKSLSRKVRGSNNWKKACKRVSKLHEYVRNSRNDFLHKVSTSIINENQVIVIEDLQIKNMMQNHHLAASIADVSWGTFRRMLTYKAQWYGRTLVIAPSSYPSSQLCSECGYRNRETKDLSVRSWVCPNCHSEHDRDINAAKNLLKLA